MIFFSYYSLLLLSQNTPVQHIFVSFFGDFFGKLSKNRKKSGNFLQFFLSVYQ